MEIISLKLDECMLKNIDTTLKNHNFSTRTEFIRNAIRKELKELSKEDLIKEFMKFRGKAKKKISDEELKIIREQAVMELAKEKGWKI